MEDNKMQIETEKLELKLEDLDSYEPKGNTVTFVFKDGSKKSVTFSVKKEQKECIKQITDYWDSF